VLALYRPSLPEHYRPVAVNKWHPRCALLSQMGVDELRVSYILDVAFMRSGPVWIQNGAIWTVTRLSLTSIAAKSAYID
jgi:hypothetical protein